VLEQVGQLNEAFLPETDLLTTAFSVNPCTELTRQFYA